MACGDCRCGVGGGPTGGWCVVCGGCGCGAGGDGRPTGGWREACGVKVAAAPVGGGRARAGLEIDHSERSSRVAISRAGRRPPAHTAAIDNKMRARGADGERAGRPRAARRSGGGVPNGGLRWEVAGS